MTAAPPLAEPPFGAAQRQRGIAAAIACIAVYAVAAALSHPLLSLLMERQGASSASIGINTAMAAVATLIVAPFAPRAMARLGVPAFLLLCLALAIVSLIGFKLYWSEAWWLAMRFVLGAAAAGLFFASEFWIVSVAPDAIRGRIVAAYAVTLSLGFAIGPSILLVAGTVGWAPFLTAIAFVAAAAIPLVLARRDAPTAEATGAQGAISFFWTDPTLIWAVVLFGAVEFGAISLIPIWGLRIGLEEQAAIALTVALAIGNLAFQPAIGWAADRAPARGLLLMSAAAVIVAAAALPAVSDRYPVVVAIFVVFGGLAAGLYTVSLTAMGGRYRGAKLASANAAIVMAYGLGALIGPPLVGVAMDLFGPDGLPAAIGGMAVGYFALALFRARATRRS